MRLILCGEKNRGEKAVPYVSFAVDSVDSQIMGDLCYTQSSSLCNELE